MIPQIQASNQTNSTIQNITIKTQPSLTYRDTGNNIIGKIDGLEAITQAVWHILNTERYAYAIYPDWYGFEAEKYKGQPFSYLEAQIENDLRSALLQDDRIYDIIISEIVQLSVDSASVKFNVYSQECIIEGMELEINV
jgi:hypothetical protein